MDDQIEAMKKKIAEALNSVDNLKSQGAEGKPAFSPRETAIVYTKLQEAILWADKIEELGGELNS